MGDYVRLPDAELEVMQALWAQKEYPASSGELMEHLRGKHWRLPTLLSSSPGWRSGASWPARRTAGPISTVPW